MPEEPGGLAESQVLGRPLPERTLWGLSGGWAAPRAACALHRTLAHPICACPDSPTHRHWESYAKAEIRQLRKQLEAQQQQQQQQQGGGGEG